jgi:transposase InsO family protein
MSSSTGYGAFAQQRCVFDGDATKYEQWEVKFLAYMKLRQLKSVILAPNTPAEGTTEPTAEQLEQCFAELVPFLDDRSLNLIMRDARDDGRKALQILRAHYAGTGSQRIISLWNQISSLQKQRSEDLTDYIIRAETLQNAIKSAGEIVSDTLLIACVMKGLPTVYKPFTVVITQSDSVKTFQQFKIAIRNFEENERASCSTFDSSGSSIMKAKHDNDEDPTAAAMKAMQISGKPKGKLVCFTCNTPGHRWEQCPNGDPPNNNQRNHPSQTRERNNSRNPRNQWCGNCRNSSHSEAQCRRRPQNPRDRINHVRFEDEVTEDGDHSYAFMNRDICCIAPNHDVKPDLLLVDCGATSHMINDESKFIDFDNTFKPEKQSVELVDGKIYQVAKKRGTVVVDICDENGIAKPVTLHEALYIPSYPHSIFSVRTASRIGGSSVILTPKTNTMITKDETQFPIRVMDSLYYLQMSTAPNVPKKAPGESTNDGQEYITHANSIASNHVDDPSTLSQPMLPSKKTVPRALSLEDWHRVLGHVNKSDLMKLESVVNDMKITNKDDFMCEPCILSKQFVTRNREADERATAPFQLVHSDLAGPIEQTAREGFRYAMNFVDDFSSCTFVYFLKNKSDAARALQKFLGDSAPYGKVVKIIRSDNGGEYTAGEFEDIILQNNIKHERSSPDSPHQNGTAERNWRTLFEMGRAMLLESKVPKTLWTYAIMTAAYLRNRMYHQRIKETPHFLLTGKKPSIKDLHVFGSICYAHVHEAKKLEAKSEKGIFIGYDKYSPAYLIYFPSTNKVKKSRTVTFTEKFHFGVENEEKKNNNMQFEMKQTIRTDQQNINIQDTPAAKITATDEETNILNPNTTEELEEDIQDVEIEDQDLIGEQIQEEQEPRYPTRDRRPPKYLSDYALYVDFCYKSSEIPTTFTQVMNSDEVESWKSAMDSEISSLKDNNTFTVVPLPEDKKVVGSRWVFSIKSDPQGNKLHKARFVAKGFSQVAGSDYGDTFSPTPKMTTIRTLLQFAVDHELVIHQLDVKTAYLNAPIDYEVYIRQPDGYKDSSDSQLVWKLNKSLYGLKQSGRNWNSLLTDFLKESGFKQSQVDACLFIKQADAVSSFIAVWVDDIIVAANHITIMEETKNVLKTRFKMKDMGPISWFLGIEFKQYKDCIEMSQSHYLNEVLSRFGMADCKPRSTPCELKLDPSKESNHDDLCPETGDEKRFREIIGSLIYAMTCTRPDLAFVVTRLSQHLANPTDVDWITVKHVLRYIKGSVNQKLLYTKSKDQLKLEGFSDSDWASDSSDRRSTTGYYFRLNEAGPPISWKSKKQQTVALSSCEAEYMALASSTQEALFLRMLTKEFALQQTDPICIHGDNQGSLDLVRNPVSHDRSKHIDIKFHFIREKFTKGLIDVSHVPSGDNIADMMTKPVTKVKLNKFRGALFGPPRC